MPPRWPRAGAAARETTFYVILPDDSYDMPASRVRSASAARYCFGALLLAAQLVPQLGRLLVVFVGHGTVKLLAQRLLDVMIVAKLLLDLLEVLDHGILVHLLFGLVVGEEAAQFFQTGADLVDRGFGVVLLDAQGGGGLRALK